MILKASAGFAGAFFKGSQEKILDAHLTFVYDKQGCDGKVGVFMEKIVQQCLLYDFYGELLNKHQRQIYEDAVYHDLSLSEIAALYGISKQGVHDLIKRCDKLLVGYEDKLHLVERFAKVKGKLARIETCEDLTEIRRLAGEILEEL